MRKYMIAVTAAVALSGCAGRAPAPVSVVQPQDRYMDCAAIGIEVREDQCEIAAVRCSQEVLGLVG